MNGLTRPVGPVKIKKTSLRSPDVLIARLSGASKATVAVVRLKGEHYFVAPKRLGGIREVPADSLVDCMNYSVRELGRSMKAKKRLGGKK